MHLFLRVYSLGVRCLWRSWGASLGVGLGDPRSRPSKIGHGQDPDMMPTYFFYVHELCDASCHYENCFSLWTWFSLNNQLILSRCMLLVSWKCIHAILMIIKFKWIFTSWHIFTLNSAKLWLFQNIRTFRKTKRLICGGRGKKSTVLYCSVPEVRLDYLRFSFKGDKFSLAVPFCCCVGCVLYLFFSVCWRRLL